MKISTIIFRGNTTVKDLAPGFTGDPKNVDDVKKFLLSYFLSSRRFVSFV